MASSKSHPLISFSRNFSAHNSSLLPSLLNSVSPPRYPTDHFYTQGRRRPNTHPKMGPKALSFPPFPDDQPSVNMGEGGREQSLKPPLSILRPVAAAASFKGFQSFPFPLLIPLLGCPPRAKNRDRAESEGKELANLWQQEGRGGSGNLCSH